MRKYACIGILSPSQRTVVGQKDAVVRFTERRDRIRHLLRTGAAYGATGTSPSCTTASGRIARESGIPAIANEVATGGWACTTLFTCGFSR